MSGLLPETDPALWVGGTFVLRLGEAVIAALPDLLIGVLIAGLLRHFVGDERLRGWFGSGVGGWWRTALAVVALPVGAAGVLPVAVVLRRAGVGTPAVAAVLLVGGAVGPLSLAYLMERASPAAAGVLVALLVATVGLLMLVGRGRGEPIGDDAAGLAPALAEARPLLGRVAGPLAVGLVAFAAVAALLPPSFLGEAMHDPSPAHLTVVVALPGVAFYPPALAALFSGEAAAGAYPGAAWTTLLGGGVTLGSAWLLFTLVGRREGLKSLGAFAVAVAAGFALLHVAPRLVPPAAEDSHAFDGLSRPFHVFDDPAGPVAGVVGQWAEAGPLAAGVSAGVLLLLCVLPLRGPDRPHLSPRTLRGLGVAGLAVWVVGTLYVYFPSPAVALEQMRHPEGELSAALGQGDPAVASAALGHIDRLASRGHVGARLRFDAASAEQLAGVSAAVAEARPRVARGRATLRDVAEVFRATARAR